MVREAYTMAGKICRCVEGRREMATAGRDAMADEGKNNGGGISLPIGSSD